MPDPAEEHVLAFPALGLDEHEGLRQAHTALSSRIHKLKQAQVDVGSEDFDRVFAGQLRLSSLGGLQLLLGEKNFSHASQSPVCL